MYCKKHVFGTKIIIALCDKELIGKVLQEDKVTIDLEKFKHFYVGDDLKLFDGRFDSINAVGKKSIKYLVDKGYLDVKNIKKINKIPHVQIYKN